MMDYVCIDLEMTGLNPKTERILEIGAVKVQNGKIIDCFQRIVNPHRKLTDQIVELTGITNEMVKDGVEDWDGVQELFLFAGDLPYVGHHFITDAAFLKQCAMNHKKKIKIMAVDTLKLAQKFLPREQKKNLTALANHLCIEVEGRHRAYDDAVLTFQIMEWFRKQYHTEFPEAFLPTEFIYQVKKQGPITSKQIKQLHSLLLYHKIPLDCDLDKMARSEASRFIDKIILQYGRIPSDVV